jgi:hypothetical protein
MQEIRTLQPLKIFSRLVLPAWMSSLRHTLASRQATQIQATPAPIAGSSIAVASELGRNAKQALEWELRKANLHLVPPGLFEPSEGSEYQPAKRRKKDNEAESSSELVPCKLPGMSKKSRAAWQISKAPEDLFDLFHPGKKPLAGFFRCSSSCNAVHTLFASNSAYCHAASLLYFTTDSVLKTTAGVPNVMSCSCTGLGMFVDQAALHQNHPNMVDAQMLLSKLVRQMRREYSCWRSRGRGPPTVVLRLVMIQP